MSDGIRLGGTLRFRESEKYIEKKVEELNSSHRITEFIGYLLRIAFDSPQDFKKTEDLEATMQFMEKHGITPTFNNYLVNTRKEIANMQDKIDKIYDMCKDMYTMSVFSKTIGLEDKTTNTAKAIFLIEKQLNDLIESLGVSSYAVLSQDTSRLEDDASRTLEYIINRYSNVVDELKSDVASRPVFVAPTNVVESKPVKNEAVVNIPKEVEKFEETSDKFDDELIENETTPNKEYADDDVIEFSSGSEDDDFGDDDMFKPMANTANLGAYNKLFKKS